MKPLLFTGETKELEGHRKNFPTVRKILENHKKTGGLILHVIVYQNQVDRALKVLKRQLNKEGLFRELKRRRFFVKPSIKKKLKIKEAKKKRKQANRRSRSLWNQ